MVFCGECGKKNPDGAHYCINCNAILPEPEAIFDETVRANTVLITETRESPSPFTGTSKSLKRDSRIDLGRFASGEISNVSNIVGGIIILIFGLVLVLYRDFELLSYIPFLAVMFLIIGILSILVGIILIVSGFTRSMQTVYLKGGYCQIVNKKCACKGGCNHCVFALKYIEMVNPVEQEE